mmetsp:Transcript_45617/g.84576  ORF Transcript_45617/g.84576 Transcript_45617/m.84576 type:complete len:120 (-) Transcript_45617:313-672(-)|eukprot:CAMPEP_0197432334 /NCGR_PEP_ID=MMETSP1175-20131217/411_1 /TAXON_ID=1003142 /ORGANISM="Triceratium dubium, Strain CCMP147" /LENGTH=119 /DNA_ID=CAMNT_0042960369 /DNA_START=64 /DNA_END=423 /DNA_ORIENTATION=+
MDTTEIPYKFVFEGKADHSVAVVGTFNHWTVDHDPMQREGDGDRWVLTKKLHPGRYEYKFVVDGEKYVEDPHAHESDNDGFGGTNSIVTVGGNTKDFLFDIKHVNKPVVAHDRGMAYNT